MLRLKTNEQLEIPLMVLLWFTPQTIRGKIGLELPHLDWKYVQRAFGTRAPILQSSGKQKWKIWTRVNEK